MISKMLDCQASYTHQFKHHTEYENYTPVTSEHKRH